MTTTELINLLRQNEHGGASGRPREVYFEIGDRCINTDGIDVTGGGDGLFAELYLSLPCADRKGKWIYHDDDDMRYDTYHCSSCRKLFTVDAERFDDIGFVKEDLKYCPNCGADMRGENDARTD